MSFTLHVASRSSPSANKATSSPFPLKLDLSESASLTQVRAAVVSKVPSLSPERQRLTTEDKKPLLDEKKSLVELGLKSGDTIWVKDLGPQIAWRTVFLTEYAGPLFIHPIFFYLSSSIYGKSFAHSRVQDLTFYLVLLHYLKRELETVFVHRFSSATMPLFNIFKNSIHYWIFSGVLLGGAVYGPWLSASRVSGTIQDNPIFLNSCVTVWALAQVGNAYSHVILRNLRPAGTRVRKIPRGFFFELISCPNYFFEAIAWLAITVMTFSPAAALFAAISTGQMAIWAVKKHKQYRKEFPDYPRSRRIMVPFVF